jgi:hypothetical protein
MKTPVLKTKSERVVFIPEVGDSRPSVPMVIAVIAAVAAMLVGGTLVYFWQQGRIHDLDASVQEKQVAATTASVDRSAALAVNAQLQVEIGDLQQQVQDAKDQSNIFQGQSTSAERQLEHAKATLATVKSELAAVTGPKLSHGDHIGYVLAAGSAEVPTTIVIDPGRWFTGTQAQKAALADGAILAGEHVKHGRYLRNTEGSWSIMQVAPGALFTVHHYNGTTSSISVSLSALAGILASPGPSSERTAHNPFWVTVSGGLVTGGREQPYQAP